MGRVYTRHCNECGKLYTGAGKSFCSKPCDDNSRRSEDKKKPPVDVKDLDEKIRTKVEDEIASVVVMASKAIKTPEELFEQSGMDPDVWEIIPDQAVIKTWPVQMKVEGYPVTIPCFYVAIKLRKRWEHSRLPTPIIIDVPTPPAPTKSEGVFTSVHYSDIHFPHHDPRVLTILYKILEELQPDLVVDHGDLLDCEQLSRWPKDPFDRTSLKDELKMAAEHCGIVHSLTPHADHWFLEGNHEARIRKTIWALAESRSAGELLTLPDVADALRIPKLLGIEALGWEYTPYPKHRLLFNRLVLCHGETAKKDSGASEKAEYQRYGKGGISGHTHRVGFYGRTDYNGVHGWWGLGMSGKIRDEYVSFPDWQQGFLCVTMNQDKTEYHVERIRIFDGVAYFRGKRYDA